MHNFRHLFLASCALLATIAVATTIHAEPAFPSNPVTIVVPYGAGGGVDIFARQVALKMGEKLGTPVVVENKPGAATAIAASDVARAKPDGYRILIGDVSTFSTNPFLYKKLSYDPSKDFTFISMGHRTPYLLVVNPKVHPYNTLPELLAAIKKAPPGTVTYGSAGTGGPGHLTGAMFERAAGVRLVHVPYKGSGPAIPDLLSGQIGMMFLDYGTSRGYLSSGKLRVLATGSSLPSSELPNVAPIAATLPRFESFFWAGFAAPKGTPPQVVDKLREAYIAAMNDPSTRQKVLETGVEPLQGTGADMEAYVRSETAKMAKVVKESQIQVE